MDAVDSLIDTIAPQDPKTGVDDPLKERPTPLVELGRLLIREPRLTKDGMAAFLAPPPAKNTGTGISLQLQETNKREPHISLHCVDGDNDRLAKYD